jgi:hypothetical protein
MCTTLHPLLLQLKSVCTVPTVVTPVEQIDAWRDLTLIDLDDSRIAPTDGLVSIGNSRSPSSGVVNGNFEVNTVFVGEGGIDDITVGVPELVNTNPLATLDPGEFNQLINESNNPVTVVP